MEYLILDKVIDHVERQGEFGTLIIIFFERDETFGIILRKYRPAELNGGRTDIDTKISRVICKTELIAVAAAKFDYGLNLVLGNEIIQDISFELSETVIRPTA